MSECTHHIVITSLLQPLQDGGAHEPGPGDGGGVLSDLLVGEGGHQAVSHPGILRPAIIMYIAIKLGGGGVQGQGKGQRLMGIVKFWSVEFSPGCGDVGPQVRHCVGVI